jgi:hypothetical protein
LGVAVGMRQQWEATRQSFSATGAVIINLTKIRCNYGKRSNKFIGIFGRKTKRATHSGNGRSGDTIGGKRGFA